jgi:hypothetical protein
MILYQARRAYVFVDLGGFIDDIYQTRRAYVVVV